MPRVVWDGSSCCEFTPSNLRFNLCHIGRTVPRVIVIRVGDGDSAESRMIDVVLRRVMRDCSEVFLIFNQNSSAEKITVFSIYAALRGLNFWQRYCGSYREDFTRG